MKTFTITATFILILFLGENHLHAQESTKQIPPPSEPLVASPTPGLSWKINISYGGQKDIRNSSSSPEQTEEF